VTKVTTPKPSKDEPEQVRKTVIAKIPFISHHDVVR
jgi:hypothetical protein